MNSLSLSAQGRILTLCLGTLAIATTFGTKTSLAAATDDHASTVVNPLPPVMTPQSREVWRKYLKLSPLPHTGCFTTKYPSTQWRETPCKKGQFLPYQVREGQSIAPYIVGGGNGNDWSANETGLISADGSFDPVETSVASETGIDTTGSAPSRTTGPNHFSLQLNTNFFPVPQCAQAKDPSKCRGIVQFIYSNQGMLLIQYWLDDFNGPCPDGFRDAEPNCAQDSAGQASPTPIDNIGELAQLSLSAAATAEEDTLTFANGDTAWSIANRDPLGLAGKWNTAEFNVFGDSSKTRANFNPGAKIVVIESVDNGTLAAPNCIAADFTGETNNLSLSSTPAIGKQLAPQIRFVENTPPVPPASCAAAAGKVQDVVFRWFSPKNGDHFYTQDVTGEHAPTAGYHKEGAPFSLFPAGTPGTTAFFRWFCPSNGHHFYTTDTNGELAKQNGCHLENTLGFIATSPLTDTRALFRWYNSSSGDHFYTTDPHGEQAASAGYHQEMVSGFVKRGLP